MPNTIRTEEELLEMFANNKRGNISAQDMRDFIVSAWINGREAYDPNTLLITDSEGIITSSDVTATEAGYLSGVTSNIQDQLDNVSFEITGAASTIVDDNLTASRAVISNGSGKIDVSSVTSTELGYVSGVTSALQTQINDKQSVDATLTALASYNTNGILVQTAADTFTGRTITGTTNQVNVSNGNGVSGNPTLSLPQNIHTSATPTFSQQILSGNTTSTLQFSGTSENPLLIDLIGGSASYEYYIGRAGSSRGFLGKEAFCFHTNTNKDFLFVSSSWTKLFEIEGSTGRIFSTWGSENPSNLEVAATGETSIDLTWDDNADFESHYVIERSTDNVNFSVVQTTAADAESWSDSGLTSDTTYYYRVMGKFGPLYSTVLTGSDTTSAGSSLFIDGIWMMSPPDANNAGRIDLEGFSGGWPNFGLNEVDDNSNSHGPLGEGLIGDTVLMEVDGSPGDYFELELTSTASDFGSGFGYTATIVDSGGSMPTTNDGTTRIRVRMYHN